MDGEKTGTIPYKYAHETAKLLLAQLKFYRRMQSTTETKTGTKYLDKFEAFVKKQGCLACNSTDDLALYAPCNGGESSCTGVKDLPGFRPSKFPIADRDAMRGLSSLLLLILAISFAIQALGNVVAMAGNMHFRGKYLEDWKKLKRWETWLGCLTKKFPLINRPVNTALMFVIGFAFYIFFFLRVCSETKNDFDEIEYHPQVMIVCMINVVLYSAMCVFGTIFRRHVSLEVAFLDPDPTPTEADISRKGDLEPCTCRWSYWQCCYFSCACCRVQRLLGP